MQGKRIADGEWPEHPGEYGYPEVGRLIAMTPSGHLVMLKGHGKDKDWNIVEHEDGAITASPSIRILNYIKNEKGEWIEGPDRWHGYLEHGIWREC